MTTAIFKAAKGNVTNLTINLNAAGATQNQIYGNLGSDNLKYTGTTTNGPTGNGGTTLLGTPGLSANPIGGRTGAGTGAALQPKTVKSVP